MSCYCAKHNQSVEVQGIINSRSSPNESNDNKKPAQSFSQMNEISSFFIEKIGLILIVF